MTEEQRLALDVDGYVVLSGILDERTVEAMRWEAERLLARAHEDPANRGGGTLHVDVPTAEASPFAPAWKAPEVAAAVAHLIGTTTRPNRAHFRSALPGYGAQTLHRDWTEPGTPGNYLVATLIVALCDFTGSNGATRVVPRSQHLPGTPKLVDSDAPYPQQRVLACPAGSAIVLNGHLWHSGTRNRSGAPRPSLQVVFQKQ